MTGNNDLDYQAFRDFAKSDPDKFRVKRQTFNDGTYIFVLQEKKKGKELGWHIINKNGELKASLINGLNNTLRWVNVAYTDLFHQRKE